MNITENIIKVVVVSPTQIKVIISPAISTAQIPPVIDGGTL
jgi:hypothetical protein